MEVYGCTFCPIRNVSIVKYLRHLQCFHESEPNFSVKCIFGCPNVYKKISSYWVHIFRKHNKRILHCTKNEDLDIAPEEHDYDEDCDETVSVDNFPEQFTQNIQRHFALFCLRLQEQHVVSRTVTNSVANEVKSLIGVFSEQYRDLIKKSLSESGIQADSQANLNLLLEKDIFGQCFDHVASDYQFERYCVKEFGLIEPIEYVLGFDPSGKKETFQYIPILEVLKKIVQRSEVFHALQEKNASDTDNLKDFTDGLIFKKHKFFSCHSPEELLKLQLYTDEFEITNCLGSKKLIHKIACIYFVLGNLPLKYRSQLKNIHVAILVKNRLLQKYGYERLLQPLIRDLKHLETNGVTVEIDKEYHTIKGALFSVSADNLSAHALAGFNTLGSKNAATRFDVFFIIKGESA